MKKIIVLLMILGLLLLNGIIQTGYAQKVETPSQPTNFSEFIKGFIQNVTQSVSFLAADLGFDYRERPVVGILVSDFYNPAGEEIEIGNQIASELRAALNKGKQFHVYGKEHPVSQSLKAGLTADPKWNASSQRTFQQNLLKKFKPFPIDLIIDGQVSREPENRIKVTANLIPFYKPISLVESETGRTDILTEQFYSPALSLQEMDKALSVIQIPTVAKGRLVIVSLLKIKKGKDPERGTLLSQDRTTTKSFGESSEIPIKPLSIMDIACWLDEKELSIVKDWEDFKKKEYHDILSGFGADTIWFDDMIKEGPHSIFFSLAQDPSKNKFKTFSKSFSIKGGTSNYMFFSIDSDLLGEPEVRYVIDPENRSIPF
ncbi:MAG: hypothetical protein ABSE95_11550 [Thermodesulfobacteriota bacterium]